MSVNPLTSDPRRPTLLSRVATLVWTLAVCSAIGWSLMGSAIREAELAQGGSTVVVAEEAESE